MRVPEGRADAAAPALPPEQLSTHHCVTKGGQGSQAARRTRNRGPETPQTILPTCSPQNESGEPKKLNSWKNLRPSGASPWAPANGPLSCSQPEASCGRDSGPTWGLLAFKLPSSLLPVKPWALSWHTGSQGG